MSAEKYFYQIVRDYRTDLPKVESALVLKETTKTYVVQRCRASGFGAILQKSRLGMCETPEEAWTNYIESAMRRVSRHQEDIKDEMKGIEYAKTQVTQ